MQDIKHREQSLREYLHFRVPMLNETTLNDICRFVDEQMQCDTEGLIQDLLQIHCDSCDGENYGCRGCQVKPRITSVVYRHYNKK